MADEFSGGFDEFGEAGEFGERQLNIHFTPEIMAGVYANYARLRHSPYELTVTFGEVGDEGGRLAGLAVARVHMSPRFTSELIEALHDNFSKWRYTQGVRDLPESETHHESEDADLEDEVSGPEVPSALRQLETSATRPAADVALEPALLAGVYANFANVSHSEYEFTITFARIDHEVDEPQVPGVVVTRVNCAPLFVRELIGLLEDAYASWHDLVEHPAGEAGPD